MMDFFDPINTYAITGIVLAALITWFVSTHSDDKHTDKHKKKK